VWQNGTHCVGFNEHSRAGVVLFNTEWRFMLCFARTGAWKKTLLGVFLLFAGGMALGNVPQLPDWTKEKVPARAENVLGGSFMSVDPVLTDANTGASFNRYVYANNSPYNNVDPDGRNPALAARISFKVSYEVATALGAGRLGAQIGVRLYDLVNSPAQNSASSSEDKPNLLTPDVENHVLNGDSEGGGHLSGTGSPGKSEFPPGWTGGKIVGEISDVATAPDSVRKPGRDGATVVTGTRDCVRIRCIVGPDGQIITGFPEKGPGVVQNPKEKPPPPPKEEPSSPK
jgi:Bacterial EndoU nuclease